MKHLPITREIREELDAISTAAWGRLNGKPLTREDVGRIAHLASELRRFDDYGREDECPSALYHGPGHQSRCGCVLKPDHSEPHTGEVLGQTARWNGLVAFDELPEVE